MNPQLWWQVARAGGLVAYGLLAASTIWGLAVSTRLLGRWPAPGWTLDLHRYLGGLALTFTGIHLAALLLDSYIQFDVLDLLVPFAAAWRPGAVAWGVVAIYLLVAVQATSLARRRLPHRLWRRIHLAAFPLFPAATAHLLTAGSDRANPAVPDRHARAPYFGVVALAAGFVLGGAFNISCVPCPLLTTFVSGEPAAERMPG